MYSLETVSVPMVRAARERIRDIAIRTPLIRLNMEDAPAEIFLKLEDLQPIRSFKICGAANAILTAGGARLDQGVCTTSAATWRKGWPGVPANSDWHVLLSRRIRPLKRDWLP